MSTIGQRRQRNMQAREMLAEIDGWDWRQCRECGCTDVIGCEDGCWWVQDGLCSTCAVELDMEERERRERLIAAHEQAVALGEMPGGNGKTATSRPGAPAVAPADGGAGERDQAAADQGERSGAPAGE